MEDKSICPVCYCKINQDDVDLNRSVRCRPCWLIVPCTCPNCSRKLKAYFYAYDHSFSHFETA